MSPATRAKLIELIDRYGEARADKRTQLADSIYSAIQGIVGPNPSELVHRYYLGESFDELARSTGMTRHFVRTTILSAGVQPRRQGRVKGK